MGTSVISNLIKDFWVVPTAATTMILALGISEPLIPSKSHQLPQQRSVKYEWEARLQNQYSQFTIIEDIEKLDVIAGFTKKLLENAEPLDPSFSEIVSKHFWELV